MTSINYLVGIVKILESPKQEFFDNGILVTRCRGQLPLVRNANIIELTFWGNLAEDIVSYYKAGDYLMIEGYLSLRTNNLAKKTEVSVSKVYPLYSDVNNSRNMINYTLD